MIADSRCVTGQSPRYLGSRPHSVSELAERSPGAPPRSPTPKKPQTTSSPAAHPKRASWNLA